MSVRIGLGFGVFPFSRASAFWRWIEECEDSKVDSIWLSERLVGPQPFLEPISAMAAIAGHTKRLKFGMNTTILPLRDPLILAKECATIDFLSQGRFLPMFGVGADTAPEWAAIGSPTGNRGRRANEMIEIMQRLWTEDEVSFEGKFFRYEGASISPKPKQTPLPVWIGGSSDAAIERTARYAGGWLAGAAQSPAQIARVIGAIRARALELGRRIEEDHFGCSVSFRFGTWEDQPVQAALEALRARLGSEVDPKAFLAVGGAGEISELLRVLHAVGVSKFVLRPLASSDEEMLEQSRLLESEVIPEIHALP